MPGVEPKKLLLRREDVLAWTGLPLNEFKKLVKAGVVVGKALREGGRKFYGREHIRRVLIAPYED